MTNELSNKIVQTLEAIHVDIKSAKDALKDNNVKLESNSTSTLSNEINKIPTAIKTSDVLEGFNNGKNTLYGGFIYNTESANLNSANAVLLSSDEYIIPSGKTIDIDFPSVEVANDMYNTKGAINITVKTAEPVVDIYTNILKPLYKTYVDKKLIKNEIAHNYTVNIHLDDILNMSGTDTLRANEFVFPNFNTNFYYRRAGQEQDTLITKFNVNKFHYSLNYKGKNLDITCNELVIDLDSVFPYTENAGHNGYESIDTSYYTFNDDIDAHIIKLPVFNVSYNGILNQYNGIAEHVHLDQPNTVTSVADNVQIRTEETPDNIAKLNEDANLAGILRIFSIFNMDGTKKYDPNTKTFVDKDTYIESESSLKFIKDRNAYFSDGYLMGLLNNQPTNAKEYFDNLKTIKRDVLYKLTISTGYAYFDNTIPISGDMIRYDDYKQPSVYENFPMLHVDEDAIRFNRESRPNGSSMIIGSNEVKFAFADVDDIRVRYVLPLLNICSNDAYGDPVTYNGITLQISNRGIDENRDGIRYKRLDNAANLIASPYTTKFVNGSSEAMENVYTVKAPLVYNKNIKRVLIKSDSHYKGELECLIGYGLIYLVNDPQNDKPEVPATPMKYIIDNETSIHSAKSKLYNNKVGSYVYVLGPASTDELAKYYDKYVHVLCPEDHHGLGTYDFCKFRLPLYNLDETKKYNYSKKIWEPVGATTDDSLTLEAIYPTEYAAARDAGKEPQVYTNQGFELNSI